MASPSYRGYRFPADVIQRSVWITLSYRDVEDLLAECGIQVSYEFVLRWVLAFGPGIARRLRARRSKPHGRWHLDEMFVRIDEKQMSLWRVQSKRDKAAARKLMRKLLKKYTMVPDEWVTDRYAAYGAALKVLDLTTPVHISVKRMNNQAENSHVPVRRRVSKLQGFKTPGSAQRFLSMQAATYNTFTIPSHLTSARTHRLFRAEAVSAWRDAAGVAA